MPGDFEPIKGTQEINSDTGKDELPTNRFTIGELWDGSALMKVEAAVGIQVGKIEPVGYDQVVDLFRTKDEEITGAHCIWFLAEAEKAGRMDDLERDFPDVRTRAQKALNRMKERNPSGLAGIITRVREPDYSVQRIREMQALAESVLDRIIPRGK